MRAGIAVAGLGVAWALACAGAGPRHAVAVVKLVGGDETQTTEVMEDLERAGSTVRVTHDGADFVLTLSVEAPSEEEALRACAAAVEQAGREQREAHRKDVAAKRAALAAQMPDATPEQQNELRRKMEDLTASLDRDDLVILTKCAAAPP